MKDQLLDLIQNIHGLGVVEVIKVSGTDSETTVAAIAEDKTVIIEGVFKEPISEFEGTFGMPNLSKLKTILGFEEYDNTATINVSRIEKNGEQVPAAIHFETKNQDFVNDYRLMSKAVVEDKVKKVMFKGATWNVEFVPSLLGIQQLKKQASANSEELNFSTKTEGGDLKIFFGDHSTHSGNFVFQPKVGGELTKTWRWPVKTFLSIMDLPGEKKVKIADAGAAEITVDSGLANYTFLLPAQQK